MPWIESHTVLSRHRKLKELARSLRLKPVHVMGHLHALWHDALEQQEDGDLTKWSDELIAESSQFDGDVPQYVSLLHEHGWLENRLIHDWLDYAGGYLSGKYHNSNRERLIEIWAKHGRRYGRKERGNIEEVISNAPNQTLPDQTLPTEPKSLSRIQAVEFAKVYDRYPNKDSRKESERCFNGSVKTEKDFADIQKALDNYLGHLKTETWKKPKSARTWFNNWRDWINYTEVPNAPNGRQSGVNYTAIARAKRQAEGLRTVASPREILAGVGDMPDVQVKADADRGNGQ